MNFFRQQRPTQRAGKREQSEGDELSKMRVLLLSTSDTNGGAARAAYRLAKGLKIIGTEHQVMVENKGSDDPSVLSPQGVYRRVCLSVRHPIDSLPLRLYRQRAKRSWSVGWCPSTIVRRIRNLAPDIVHLHLVNSGFVPVWALSRLNVPIVWTLHDMWPMTGGCHFDDDCGRYTGKCGKCPQLGSSRAHDLSWLVLAAKRNQWRRVRLTLAAPSNWIASCARKSSLFANVPITVIPYGLDLGRFHPTPKDVARTILGLAPNKKTLLFGAMRGTADPRKGFEYLRQAVKSLPAAILHQTQALVFGASSTNESAGLPIQQTCLPHIHDDITLSLLYSAADLLVAPSLQDNLPNTVIEALACGTPSLAFRIGGMPDLIQHGATGYLAEPKDSADLSKGLISLLEAPDRLSAMAIQARTSAEQRFSLEIQATRYRSLYETLLSTANQADPVL
jgi:glycosyltransferase involved in cell wall biosynthesis